MGSSANINGLNLELTPMRVTYDGIDIGGTKGGVTVASNFSLSDLTVDQLGSQPLDSRVAAQEFMIKFSIAEVRNKDNWKAAFPHAKLVTSGPNKIMYFDSSIGDSLLARSKVLILHPLSKDDIDKSTDFYFWKAAAISASEVSYGPDDQAVLEVEMRVFPDTSVSPARFFIYGDPAVGVVNATAVAGPYTGTGNGTMTSIAVASQTVTEIITATLVTTAVNGGVFHVNGSVSGSLGLATVATPFSSSRVGFLINDGAIDFVLGDQFSITMTGANYI